MMRPQAISAEIDIEQIVAWEKNPRKHFGEEGLQELADSIRQLGLLEPLMVRMIPLPATLKDLPRPFTPETCRYHIIGGERRWRAAKMAGLETVPCRVFEVGESVALEMALVENLQRQDLDPIEEAEGYRALQELGYTQVQIAQRVNRSQPAVANTMRLLKLPADVRESIRAKELSVSHGIALLALPVEVPQVVSAVAKHAIERNLPVAKIEGTLDWEISNKLEQTGLVVTIDRNTAFDWEKVCVKCPFSAYRKDEYGRARCLNKPHYDELQERALAERKAAEEAAIAAGGKPIRKLSQLKYQEYDSLRYDVPKACTKDCPCRCKAQDYDGKLVDICIDPKRLKGLKSAETREKNKKKREGYQVKVEAVRARLDSLQVLDQAGYEVATLVRHFLSQVSDKHKSAAAERAGLSDADFRNAKRMAMIAPLQLLRCAFEAYVSWEADRACTADYYGTHTLDELSTLKPVPAMTAPVAQVAAESPAVQETDELFAWHESMRAALERIDHASNLSNRFFMKHILAGAPPDYTIWADVVTSMGARILELEKEAATRRSKAAPTAEQSPADWQRGMQRKVKEQAARLMEQAHTIGELQKELARAKASASATCSNCGLPPAECMCAEVQKRTDIAEAAQDLTCPLCGADDFSICKCEPEAVNAALVKDGRRAG